MQGQAIAYLRNLRMSPRKVRLVVDAIRGLSVYEALGQLMFMKKHASKPVFKLVRSAIANAKNNHNLDEKTLVVSEVAVDGGAMLYRYTPRAMGRATPVRLRSSHIKLVLTGEVLTAEKIEARKHEGHAHDDHESDEKKAEGTIKVEKKSGAKNRGPLVKKNTTVRRAGRKK